LPEPDARSPGRMIRLHKLTPFNNLADDFWLRAF
jgi:hypothetical protein